MRLTMKIFSLACTGIALAACGGPRTFVSPNAAMEHNVALNLLLQYDSNQDRLLSTPEFESALRADFDALDRNGDGSLDNIEVAAENDRRWQRNGSASTPLIDWNTDGIVDFAEYSSTLRSTFTELDDNDDGNLSAEELAVVEYRPTPAAVSGNPRTPLGRAPDSAPIGG
jgi:hypothetical protein